MALITDTGFEWSSAVTLTSDEIWQSRSDTLFVTTTAAPTPDDGLALRTQEAIRFSAGTQVRYRKEGSGPVVIVREAI